VQNGLCFEVRDIFEEDFRLSKQVFGNGRESRMQRRRGRKGLADTPLPTFIFNPEGKCSKRELRQPDRGDDASRQALASIQPDGGLLDSSLLRGQQAFPLLAQDEFGPRGSNGHTHLSSVSDGVHSQ
jgi:hypothetical protein